MCMCVVFFFFGHTNCSYRTTESQANCIKEPQKPKRALLQNNIFEGRIFSARTYCDPALEKKWIEYSVIYKVFIFTKQAGWKLYARDILENACKSHDKTTALVNKPPNFFSREAALFHGDSSVWSGGRVLLPPKTPSANCINSLCYSFPSAFQRFVP